MEDDDNDYCDLDAIGLKLDVLKEEIMKSIRNSKIDNGGIEGWMWY